MIQTLMENHERPRDHRINVIAVPDKRREDDKHDLREEDPKGKPADFETAISAAGYGKFQYLLLLTIIPVSWATSIDTANVSIILPSAECDLQMSFYQKGVLNAVTYVGMVSSGYLWGYIADVHGRRKVFLYGYLADGICNVLSGFSQNFWTLAFFKFLSGFVASGSHASTMTYVSEFYGIKGRARIPLIIGLSITSGNIVTAGLAWIIIPQRWSVVLWDGNFVYNPWRLFLSVCGMPTLIGVICLTLFPESPKFLMSQGRIEEALKVFKMIYRMNTGKPGEEYPIHRLEDESDGKGSTDADRDGMIEKKAIFFYPYLPRLLLVTVMQFGSMYATNTIRLWQPQLFTILDNFDPVTHDLAVGHEPTFCEILDLSAGVNGTSSGGLENATCTNMVVNGSVYVNTIIVATFGVFFLLSASLALNILNQRTLLFIAYGISSFCVIGLNWSTDTLITLLLTSLFVGLTNTTLNTNIGVTVTLFPTALRAIAVSLLMSAGRIGSIIGNVLFPVLLVQGCLAPIIEMACLMSLCILLTYFLPLSKKKDKK